MAARGARAAAGNAGGRLPQRLVACRSYSKWKRTSSTRSRQTAFARSCAKAGVDALLLGPIPPGRPHDRSNPQGCEARRSAVLQSTRFEFVIRSPCCSDCRSEFLAHLDRELRPAVLRRRSRALISGDYCRLASLFLSNTASIGPSDTMLPRRLSVGAYKFEALPPSRNRAFGHFSASRNRRAKTSNDTSP